MYSRSSVARLPLAPFAYGHPPSPPTALSTTRTPARAATMAAAAAVTATVAVTAAVVGAIFTPAQMPSNCVQVIQYNVAYMQCGSTWYQPQYQGSDVTYVVVNAP